MTSIKKGSGRRDVGGPEVGSTDVFCNGHSTIHQSCNSCAVCVCVCGHHHMRAAAATHLFLASGGLRAGGAGVMDYFCIMISMSEHTGSMDSKLGARVGGSARSAAGYVSWGSLPGWGRAPCPVGYSSPKPLCCREPDGTRPCCNRYAEVRAVLSSTEPRHAAAPHW